MDGSALGRPVLQPQVRDSGPGRWPGFGPAALEAGVEAIFAFPLQVGAIRLGVLDLYRDVPGTLQPAELAEALAFADAGVLLHLQRSEIDGRVLIAVGARVLFSYDADDAGLRNLAAVTLPGMGFTGRRVAQVLGITEEYVSMLRARARSEGSAGLRRRRGRPSSQRATWRCPHAGV